jgi:hypothetical protein
MALSTYGTQFRVIPAGETVTFSHAKTLVDGGQPVNVSFVNAKVDKGLSTEGVITSAVMSNTSCVLTSVGLLQFYITTYTLSGKYGDDLATRDIYQVINTNNYDENASSFYESEAKPTGDFPVTTYNSYSALLAAKAPSHSSTTGWNNIVKFYPDDSAEKTVTFTFLAQGVTTEFTQKVHLIPTRYFTRLNTLMNNIYAEENPSSPSRTIIEYQFALDTFTADGILTTFGPMSRTPSYKTGTTEYNVAVYFAGSNLVVTPSMYTISGNYITFTSAPPAGTIKVYHTDDAGNWLSVGDGASATPTYTSDPAGWVEPAE